MVAVMLFYLLGKATNQGTLYWIFLWIFAAWKIMKFLCEIYKAGKEARE